jgi:hypothetical protein
MELKLVARLERSDICGSPRLAVLNAGHDPLERDPLQLFV